MRSSRKLAHVCEVNLELIRLLKGLRPPARTIAYFRKENARGFKRVFRHFVWVLREMDLIEGQTIAIDSFKIRAQNSLKRNFNEKKTARHLAYIDEKISEYEEALFLGSKGVSAQTPVVRQHEKAICKFETQVKTSTILYLIIPILLLACSNPEIKKNQSVINFDSGYSLHKDTIFVEVKGEMTHALKYQDKFYVLFKQRVLKYGGYGKRWLYILSNGQVEKIVDCPKEMRTVYLDFYVKNDSLILKPYMDKQSYYLDLGSYNWIKIDKTDDLIFEDDNFQVFSLDFGEWGGKTWFKEKSTGQEYVLEATTPLVNKIDSTYYLTNSFQVLKIQNPRLLNECNDDITYENIESTGKSYSWYGEPIGFEIVYQDTTFDYFDFNYKPHIVSSFVLDSELLHIYETDSATYIARHKGNAIEPIQKILDNISFYNGHYSYRQTAQKLTSGV